MNSLWITYAWEDNKDHQIDFVAQELQASGIDVHLDRRDLGAGKPLWEQIEGFITEPGKSDAWMIYATQASLGSAACQEEYRYALDRALRSRTEDFPILALFPAATESSLIPAGIRVRLYVSLTDPEWKERIVAAVERRPAVLKTPSLEPYYLHVHQKGSAPGTSECVIEVRPRAGTWSPFVVAVPAEEGHEVLRELEFGAAGRVPNMGMLVSVSYGPSADGKYFEISAGNESTPTQSYYIFCSRLPTVMLFGVESTGPQYEVRFTRDGDVG